MGRLVAARGCTSRGRRVASPNNPGYDRNVKLPVTLERDESGSVVAECPSIPGCVSQGATEEEALANIRDAILGCLEVRAEQGMPLTVKTTLLDIAVA